MTALSNAIEELIVNHAFRSATWSKASTHDGSNQIHFAAYNTPPGEGGTGEVEADYTSYARVVIAQTSAQWTYTVTATGVRMENTNDITLVTPTVDGTDLTHFGICVDGTADPEIVGAFDAAIAATNGNAIVLPAGSIKFDFNMGNLDATDYLLEKIAKHMFWADTWTKPATNFLRIYTVLPIKDGSGANTGTAVVGNNYADVALGPNDTFWNAVGAGDGEIDLIADAVFPSPSADWTGCLGQGIHDGTGVLLRRSFASSTDFPNGASGIKLAAGATITAA